jgi:hypothetical protein
MPDPNEEYVVQIKMPGKVKQEFTLEEAKIMAEKMDAFQEKILSQKPLEGADKAFKHFAQEMLGNVLDQPFVECEEVVEEKPYKPRKFKEHLVYYPRNRAIGDYGLDGMIMLDPIPYWNVRDFLARFFITANYRYGPIPNWRQQCVGITSLDYNGPGGKYEAYHMPMLDYDGKNVKKIIRKDVKLLQKEYGLGDAWVYKTRRGYHVYFLTDLVSRDDYWEILNSTQCCKGFKKAAQSKGYAVLRVSAKYTEFDISFEYILRSRDRSTRRVAAKGHLIQALLRMGSECGTHLASVFPDQAFYEEDDKEWRPPTKKKGKRIRKVKKIPGNEAKFQAKMKPDGWVNMGTTVGNNAYNTVTWTSTTTSTDNW